MAKKEKFYEYKTIKVGGAFHHLFRGGENENWIHHNPEGPAIQRITEGDKSVEEKYYIFGHEKTKDEFKEYFSGWKEAWGACDKQNIKEFQYRYRLT